MPFKEILLDFSLEDDQKGQLNIKKSFHSYSLYFPCESTHECTDYSAVFPPGRYLVELYGASGASTSPSTSFRFPNGTHIPESTVKYYRGNAESKNISSNAGSGGYTAGILSLRQKTQVYISIGGIGESKQTTMLTPCISPYPPEISDINNIPRGGYNGGGSGLILRDWLTFGGGGATDLRISKNDWFHRILVAGGGGAADNGAVNEQQYMQSDDGSGGAGGGLEAQGHFEDGAYKSTHVATQQSGFSFGQGEAAQIEGSKSDGYHPTQGCTDLAGAGGGWYGGYASHHPNGGAGGGSSFALTADAILPTEQIQVYDEFYEPLEKEYYAFLNKEYIIQKAIMVPGIWSGSGMARITILTGTDFCQCACFGRFPITFLYIYILAK